MCGRTLFSNISPQRVTILFMSSLRADHMLLFELQHGNRTGMKSNNIGMSFSKLGLPSSRLALKSSTRAVLTAGVEVHSAVYTAEWELI